MLLSYESSQCEDREVILCDVWLVYKSSFASALVGCRADLASSLLEKLNTSPLASATSLMLNGLECIKMVAQLSATNETVSQNFTSAIARVR
jgi:hypothetical protein